MSKNKELTDEEAKERGRRLKNVLRHYGMSAADFSKIDERTPNHIRKMMAGSSQLKNSIVDEIVTELNEANNLTGTDCINKKYITGESEYMFIKDSLTANIGAYMSHVNNSAHAVLFLLASIGVEIVGYNKMIQESERDKYDPGQVSFSTKGGKLTFYTYIPINNHLEAVDFSTFESGDYLTIRFFLDGQRKTISLRTLEYALLRDELVSFMRSRLESISILHENMDLIYPNWFEEIEKEK